MVLNKHSGLGLRSFVLLYFGWTSCKSPYDPSMFTHITTQSTTIFLVYVDDIIITGTHSNMIRKLQTSLQDAFHIKDLGPLTYFLGLKVQQTKKGIFLHQHKYVIDLIALAGL
eukprot:TRINITY_DN8534_c1_g2_i6.p1 TRINITY_DN8534_c1_g2~~TRINITY_DN8534_c1_g2_i6.p1  ORF type:complete len:113 (-),score=0.54 TRINITY_DN8534_c1_g2_i6:1696-2034(-)